MPSPTASAGGVQWPIRGDGQQLERTVACPPPPSGTPPLGGGRLQPAQLWGVLWGFSRLRHLPDPDWMAAWLARAREALPDCSAEALGNMAWALGALQYTPDRLWLRALAGAAAYKARSFLAPQLAQLLSGLSALGYCPRPQVCSQLAGQLRRQLHAAAPGAQAAALHAIAALGGRWQPGRRFMFEFVTESRPKLGALGAQEAANVLWSLATLGCVRRRGRFGGVDLGGVTGPPPPGHAGGMGGACKGPKRGGGVNMHGEADNG